MRISAVLRERPIFAVAAAIALAVAIVVASVLAGSGQRGAYVGAPVPENRVVATVQTNGTGYSDSLRALMRAARARPDDLASASLAARGLIAEGRAAGDSRLVGASLGLLRPFMAEPAVETLVLAATARQYQHDFTGALTLLDRAIAADPRHAEAILTRATIQIVLGRFDLAARDCKALHALPQPQLGYLCQATSLILTAQAPKIYERLQVITGQPGLLEPGLHGWAVGLMGEIAMLQGDDEAAARHFAAVVAADPLAIRERLLLVDVLLKGGRLNAALDLMKDVPDVDGVLIRRVLAAVALGDSRTADPARAELARRFKLNLDLGLTAHAREEARYFLQIAGDPVQALARAKVNWALQHEIEDAQLLLDAAVAAGDPGAAKPVLLWMQEQGVQVPTLRIAASVRKAAE